jgi:hypothetical protein
MHKQPLVFAALLFAQTSLASAPTVAMPLGMMTTGAGASDTFVEKVVIRRGGGGGARAGGARGGAAFRGGGARAGGWHAGGVHGGAWHAGGGAWHAGGGAWHGGGARWGGWVRPGYRWGPGGAIAAGAAIGFVGAAAAASWAGAAPGPGLCWYYTDPSQTQGFWDACP